jgi:hypothetical protein
MQLPRQHGSQSLSRATDFPQDFERLQRLGNLPTWSSGLESLDDRALALSSERRKPTLQI